MALVYAVNGVHFTLAHCPWGSRGVQDPHYNDYHVFPRGQREGIPLPSTADARDIHPAMRHLSKALFCRTMHRQRIRDG